MKAATSPRAAAPVLTPVARPSATAPALTVAALAPAFAALVLVIAAFAPSLGAPMLTAGTAQAAHGKPHRPNLIVIQTDDQAREDMLATMRDGNGRRIAAMPATRRWIGARGISFEKHYTTYPLCCPSRVSLLTGRYAHSHRVIGNNAPNGGWHGFRKSGAYGNNLATWLRGGGYRTIHIGKLFNQYGTEERPETEVPPGWAVWNTDATDNSARYFYGYMLNINGEIRGPFGDPEYGQFKAVDPPGCLYAPITNTACNHKTDAITRRAVDQIRLSRKVGRPFYMQLDYNAPHGDHQPPIGPEPTPRNYGRAERTPHPRPPSFNERDISDKPSFIRDVADRLDAGVRRRIRIDYQTSLESLRDVDDGVRRILRTLNSLGMLGNTYVVFLSDNGFFRGEHRLERAKFLPYEPAVHTPLLIRGPGIRPGIRTDELVANVDIAPTLAQLAGVEPQAGIDGRSLVPYWEDPARRTRRPILLESFAAATSLHDAPGSGAPNPPSPPEGSGSSVLEVGGLAGARMRPGLRGMATGSIAAPVQNYAGVRLGRYKYVEYQTGDFELYDLARDPHELRNQIGNRSYRRVRGFLAHQLLRLAQCRGRECRAKTGPVPRPDFGRPRRG